MAQLRRLLIVVIAMIAELPVLAGAATLEVSVKSATGLPVEDTAIVLDGGPAAKRPVKKAQAEWIEQLDREFNPYLTIVQQGTAIEFPNHDPIKHHVYSFSPPKVFEIKLYSGKPANPVIFDKVGDVVLGCNIHDWMVAHVLVVDTPWFAKTMSDGLARIERVPPGKYKLRIWHPRQKSALADRELSLGPNMTKLAISLDVSPRMVIPKPRADSDSY